MFLSIAYYPILGKPLIFWLGVVSILSLIITVGFAYAARRRKIPLTWHMRMGKLTLLLALLHGLLALGAYL
ncbi:hypothetical protein [Spirochaeta thermophila]|uniref:Uncharacterized protein n=1 Tax=Winmispira thermophila (strain ATCC 49972 / DSM 6192 / RI 19.B1) TaxID=665571 RepID=E0RTQ5_WINT6|nr:hypothetical protein [Spirochaeta thermophila]ADN02430.1 hypothetical protein STHERM_c14900 [Spirochaeta thermophila DSM 6192]